MAFTDKKKNISIHRLLLVFLYFENKAPGSFQSASSVQMKVRRGSIESA